MDALEELRELELAGVGNATRSFSAVSSAFGFVICPQHSADGGHTLIVM